MMRLLVLSALVLLPAVSLAQIAEETTSAATSMAELIRQGYEIKTSSTSGSKLIVFLQKDNSAYACEFTSLTKSRCGSLN